MCFVNLFIFIFLITSIYTDIILSHQQYYSINYFNLNNEYVIEKTWSIVLNTSYNAIFTIGDFNNDGFEEIVIVSNNTIYIVNGSNGSIYRKLVFDNSIIGFRPIRDLDRDGYYEIVVLTGSLQVDRIIREFNVFNLIENRLVRKNSIELEIPYYALNFDYFRSTVYLYDTIEYIIPHSFYTGLDIKLLTYFIQYNIVDNSIRQNVVENKMYLMYTNRLLGDIDGDGAIEFTNRFIVEQYTETIARLKYVLSIKRSDGSTIYSSVMNTPVYNIVVSKSTGSYVFLLETHENSTDLETTQYRLIAVNEKGNVLYDKKIVNATSRLIPMGDLLILIYWVEHSNETFIELINTNNGSIVSRINLGVMKLEEFVKTAFSIYGLGDVDNDNVKEFFIQINNECFVAKADDTLLMYELRNCNLEKIVSSYKTLNGVNIIALKNMSKNIELESFNIYKPGVKPILGYIPKPYEQIVYTIDNTSVYIFIILAILLASLIGSLAYMRRKRSRRKRVRKH